MEKTNKKECPFCTSKNIEDTVSRMGGVNDYISNRNIPEPNAPVYRCCESNCGKIFEYFEK